jgi:outer membrane protein assembly factor BamB
VTLLRIALPIIFAALAAQSAELQTLPSAKRWSVALPARAVASPTIAGDVIVVGLQTGHVVAYSVQDGKEAWRVPLRADQAIVADETLLFVAAGETIHALDAADGKVLWEAPSGTLTAPLLVHDGWVIAATAGQLAAFREIDGAKVWSHDCPPLGERPTIEGDNLYVPLDEGRLLALNLQDGVERWTRFPAKGPLSEVLALPDRVFVGAADKYLHVYNADDGDIEWGRGPFLGSVVRGRPVSDGGRIFVATMDNLVRAYDRRTGALVWHEPLPYRPVAPAIAGPALIVPGATAEIRAFELKTGKLAGQIKAEQTLVVPPVFQMSASGILVAAITGAVSGEWTLVVLGPPPPPALHE